MLGVGLKALHMRLGAVSRLARALLTVVATASQYLVIRFLSNRKLAAENLFLRKQLALFQEREVKPRRADDASRVAMVWLSGVFNWREALVIVQPATLIRWHREGFRLFWKLKSRPGRPALPREVQRLIRQMASENPTWGEERIANELMIKLGLQVSPRTVRKYMPDYPDYEPGKRVTDQRWTTFVRNHAEMIVACDFFTVVTATFKVTHVFVVVEHVSRRILHCNVTRHPTGDWTLQQLREAIPGDHGYRFLIRDRDTEFSSRLEESVRALHMRTLKTPVRTPQANAICERTIGTIRRECLDYLIPLGERHLYRLLAEWVRHFNTARPHSALDPGIPKPPKNLPAKLQSDRHDLPAGSRVAARPVLGGLHHEYFLQLAA